MQAGIEVESVLKLHEGRPHAGDLLANGGIHLMIITSSGDVLDQKDGRELRRSALAYKVELLASCYPRRLILELFLLVFLVGHHYCLASKVWVFPCSHTCQGLHPFQFRRLVLSMALTHRILMQVPIVTTITGGLANLQAVKSLKQSSVQMIPLQDFFKKLDVGTDDAKEVFTSKVLN